MEAIKLFLFLTFVRCTCTEQQLTCTSPVYNGSTGVTIRGPCPSSQVLVPVGSTITFECSYDYFSGNNVQIPFWNITDREPIVLELKNDVNLTVSTDLSTKKTTLTILRSNSLETQCGLCNAANCGIPPQPTVISLPVQLISFGPSHLLTHQLLDNVVILRWSPPLMDYIQFQYNITVVNSDNISVMFTTLTNSTNITLHKDNISYIECSQLQWSVSAGTQYGYSELAIAEDNFTIISAPNISDEIVVSNISEILSLNFSVTVSCNEDPLNYTYHLIQEDYCRRQLNNTPILTPNIDTVTNNTIYDMSVNIQSVIDNTTWYIAIEVINSVGRDRTEFTNLTELISMYSRPCHSFISSLTSSISRTVKTTITTTTSFHSHFTHIPVTSETPTLIHSTQPTSTTVTTMTAQWIIIVAVVGGVLVLVLITGILLCVLSIMYFKKRCYIYKLKDTATKNLNINEKGQSSVHKCMNDYLTPQDMSKSRTDYIKSQQSQVDSTYQTPEKVQTLSPDNALTNSAYAEPLTDQRTLPDTNYATPEPAVNAIPLPSPLPPPTTSSSQLENVVDIPGYSEVPVNIKKTNSNKNNDSTRSPKSPLPSLPISDDSDNNINGTFLFDNKTSFSSHSSDQVKNETKGDTSTHLYAEMSEIRSARKKKTTQYTPIEFTQRNYPTPTVDQQDAIEYASIT